MSLSGEHKHNNICNVLKHEFSMVNEAFIYGRKLPMSDMNMSNIPWPCDNLFVSLQMPLQTRRQNKY